ncbi:MAG: hypothetical protein AB1568_04315 [Thermodesulfobacteriota bacterium]
MRFLIDDNGRGVALPPVSTEDGLDYDQLVDFLMNPDTDTPKGLLDALYFVHEMPTPESMEDKDWRAPFFISLK